MKRSNQLIVGFVFGVAVIAGAVAGYKIATDEELRDSLRNTVKGVVRESRQKAEEVTEEVALKTARVTNNPKINQDWVEKQWEMVTI